MFRQMVLLPIQISKNNKLKMKEMRQSKELTSHTMHIASFNLKINDIYMARAKASKMLYAVRPR
jgi:hypothetical protein